MISSIKRFFDSHIATNALDADHHQEQNLRMAVAALLVEVTVSDDKLDPEEHQAMLNSVRRHFSLDIKEASELISLANREHQEATDYHQFTRLINQHYTPDQKRQLIETLWEIAYADNELTSIEEHVIRRLADLIHLPHQTFIATKLRVQASLTGGTD